MSRSWTITSQDDGGGVPPVHPGEILADELDELGIEPSDLARQVDVPAERITEIIRGDAQVTSDLALRLGHWFGTSAQFWLNLQTSHDLRLAEAAVGPQIARLPRRPAA